MRRVEESTYSDGDKAMAKIIFYAKPGKREQKIKKLLKRWDIDFDFVEIKEGDPAIQIAREPITEIMKGWTEKEKEAGLILWEYATTLHETNIQILRDIVEEHVNSEVERIEADVKKRGIARCEND